MTHIPDGGYPHHIYEPEKQPFDASGKVLIKPNPGYFNSKLSRSAPQFFVVNITGDEKEPVAAKVMNDVAKDLDFNALRNMLGK